VKEQWLPRNTQRAVRPVSGFSDGGRRFVVTYSNQTNELSGVHLLFASKELRTGLTPLSFINGLYVCVCVCVWGAGGSDSAIYLPFERMQTTP